MFSKELKEECGVFGVWGVPHAAEVTYYGLHSLQHRGQEGCGIVSVNDNGELHRVKGLGLVTEVFNSENLGSLHGNMAVGHVRYSTHGGGGIENVSDGYELRNRFFKASLSPKDISLMDNGSDTCNLFEGFIDCLSWLELGLGYGDDYLVLNSVSLLERSFPILDRYERVNCYLDRDEAGRRTLEALRKRYADKLVDCSSLYKGYKDLNEYLQHKFL